jgi:molybdenum cofactor cytidylyltransferase
MGTPKALLDYGGETILDRLTGILAACCQPVIVVLGHQAESIRAGMKSRHDVEFVVNPMPERGQLSSLQCGLAALPESAAGVLFTPVDYPAIQPSTVESLISAFLADPRRALTMPRHEGRRGHPVIAGREVVSRILALPSDGQARDAIRQFDDDALYVDVQDPGILKDVDTPEAYRALLGASR